MFQDARLLPWLSVEENLRLAFPPLPRAPWRDKAQTAAARQGATGAFNFAFGKGKAIQARQEMDGTIDRLLTLVGLEGWKKASPRRLSGGMAQRVALVRALCRNPRILLLDEPFGALDAFTRSQLREDMDRLWHTMKRTVLLVTHDIEEAVHLADRVLLMKEGRIAGELAVPLARPRQRRSAEFQALCRKLESRME
jgi:ABC-type nitrate/sulfonate/bicarbonate transport system ATPase subunit